MYHRVFELLDKLDVITQKTEELRRVREEIHNPNTSASDLTELCEKRDYLIPDIQALCREIANDTREVKDD